MGKSATSGNSAALAASGLAIFGRRVVQIPSDVQKCLDRPDAWAPTGGPIPPIPPMVLEDVIARHAKEIPSVKRTPTQPKAKPDGENEVLASGTPIPWTPSPESHFLPVNRQRELATAARTASQHSPQQAGSLTAGNRSSRAAFLTDFPPSSSQASETGLEVEVPRAITDVIAPVNRHAVPALEPTPPSAQIIPSTIAEETNPVQKPGATRRRRMKNPAAVFAEVDTVGQSHAPSVTVPKAGTTTSSRSASSPVTSCLPAPKPPARHAMDTSPVRVSVEDRHHSTAVHQSVVTTIPQPVSHGVLSSFADKVPPTGPPVNVPFTAFKLAYPDYQATLKDFIRAVKCLLKYQKDGALSEFLYDDFIRVFCGDYLAYIGSLGVDQAACPALRWYNVNVSRPSYVSGIINKKNLTEIPKQYPEEFRAVQQGSARPRTRGHAIETGQTGQTEQNGQTGQRPAVGIMQDSRKVPSQIDNNANVSVSPTASQGDTVAERIGNVTNDTSSRGFPQSRVDSSLPVFETPQAPRISHLKREVATTLPGTMHSQISNPDSIPEMETKRKLVPRASTGSSAVEAGAVFKRPRKAMEDPEKRSLRFKEFVMQRRTQGSTPKNSKQS
ncbi:uncharacterized protein B0T15DRAFT_506925 [Chaetomium strumarium]|uniref:Uncharacterized protein n=1 Tax=Chaetomium strumarium TaxID=1170767 RepID=A0AAJ0M619_9PEZI|nr:hypothetical protein B0T15DRAFT_506925 [Chaetomium strumarium]